MVTITINSDSVKIGKDMVLALLEKRPYVPTNENDVAATAIICGTILLAIVAISIVVCIVSNRKKEKTTRKILIGLLTEKDGECWTQLKDVMVKTIKENVIEASILKEESGNSPKTGGKEK